MIAAAPFFLAFASLASLVASQGVGIGNQTIVPSSVDINTRSGWCRSEKDTCTALCSKNWSTNDCNTETLEYKCVCADGSVPDLVSYTNTLPFFICEAYIAQCVAGNATEPILQNICRNTNTCGNQDPADFTPTTTIKTAQSTSMMPTGGSNSTSTPAVTTTGSSGAPATTSPNAGSALDPPSYTSIRMLALISALGLAGFGLVL